MKNDSIKLRRDKADLMDMIRNVHVRKTWGKKYAYATYDEHTIWIQISQVDFENGRMIFKTTWENLNETDKYWQSNCYGIEYYYMNRDDFTVEMLVKYINQNIISNLNYYLREHLNEMAEEQEDFKELSNNWYDKIHDIEQEAFEKYEDDENCYIIVSALKENARNERDEELEEWKKKYYKKHVEEETTDAFRYYTNIFSKEE